MSASDHPNKHIAHEVMEWVHNGEERWGKEIVAKHNESRFLYQTVRTIVTKGDATQPKLVHEDSVEMSHWLGLSWEGPSNQRLEDIFDDFAKDSHCEDDQILAHQHLASSEYDQLQKYL